LTGSLYQVEPNVFFLGEVPRNDPDLVRVIEGTYSLKNGVASPHMFLEDTAIALDIGDSLFVISGCSHSGITNIVAHATRLLGKEVKGVIGGFHLADATQSEVKKTISKLRELGVEKIYPGHCTGFLAESEIKRFFKDGCIKLHSGFQELL
ncbi:MAG: MBL fold metallo-hydrolase, partial [Thermofilaceae archaeon]